MTFYFKWQINWYFIFMWKFRKGSNLSFTWLLFYIKEKRKKFSFCVLLSRIFGGKGKNNELVGDRRRSGRSGVPARQCSRHGRCSLCRSMETTPGLILNTYRLVTEIFFFFFFKENKNFLSFHSLLGNVNIDCYSLLLLQLGCSNWIIRTRHRFDSWGIRLSPRQSVS